MNETKIMDIYEKGKRVGEVRYWVCKKCGLLRTSANTHKHNEPLSQEVIDDIKKWEESLDEKNKSQVSGETSESGIQ